MGSIKVGDRVFVVDSGVIKEQYVNSMFDDYLHDESTYTEPMCTTSDCFCPGYKGTRRRLDEVSLNYKDVEYIREEKRRAYDAYVTRGW